VPPVYAGFAVFGVVVSPFPVLDHCGDTNIGRRLMNRKKNIVA
jgi:hypothetical protein